jgi:hypothetical protein
LEHRVIIKPRPGLSNKAVQATGVQVQDLRSDPPAAAGTLASGVDPLLLRHLEPGASMEQTLLELNSSDGGCQRGHSMPAC